MSKKAVPLRRDLSMAQIVGTLGFDMIRANAAYPILLPFVYKNYFFDAFIP